MKKNLVLNFFGYDVIYCGFIFFIGIKALFDIKANFKYSNKLSPTVRLTLNQFM